MSTKTSFKRIALVAVAALGMGVLTSVAPANAVAGNGTFSATGTNTGNTGRAQDPIASGTAATFTIDLDDTVADVAANDAVSIIATVTAGPAAKDITSTCTFTAKTVTGLTLSVQNATTGELGIVATATVTDPAGTAVPLFDVSCPTTIGGTYNVTLTQGALVTKVGFGTQVFTAPTTVATGQVIVSGLNVSQGTTRSTTAGTAQNGGNANVIWTLPTRAAATQVFKVVSSGVGSIQGVASAANATVTTVSGTAGDYSQGARVVSTANDTTTLTSVNITGASSVAGVQTLTTYSIDTTSGVVTAIGTATITWGATPVVTASTSTAFLSAGQDCAAADDATGVTLAKTAGVAMGAGATTGAAICIAVKDQNAVALNGQAISVTVAGPGLITLATGNGNVSTGTVRAASLTATTQAATNLARVGISADGTAGKSTITITAGDVVIATKTVTFYGTVTSLVAKQNLFVASKAGASLGAGTAAPTGADVANTPAVIITAKDANGIAVPGLTITALSSDTTVMTETITIAEDNGLGLGNGAGAGSYNVAVNSAANTSGKSATLTFRVMSGTTVVAATAALTFKLGGAVYTTSLALDKAAYSAGETAVANLTVKDSSGNAAFDADHATVLLGALTSSLTVVKALQFNTTATSVSSVNGVASLSFNAPGSTGAWKISGKNADGTAISASATVSSSLETLVNSLIKKINALSTLVAKIQKKLGVK
jgi:hypothetical protein